LNPAGLLPETFSALLSALFLKAGSRLCFKLFFYLYGVYLYINDALFLGFEGVFMMHSTNNQNHKEEKKGKQDAAAAPQPEKDESQNATLPDSSKTKSYADIIKGFEEIEKIFKRQNEKDK
jgi:hypothetical protein